MLRANKGGSAYLSYSSEQRPWASSKVNAAAPVDGWTLLDAGVRAEDGALPRWLAHRLLDVQEKPVGELDRRIYHKRRDQKHRWSMPLGSMIIKHEVKQRACVAETQHPVDKS